MYIKPVHKESNLTNKDAEMQLILKKIIYNAVAAPGTKLNFLIPSPILYPQHIIYTLFATSGVPIPELDGLVQVHLIHH